MPVGWTFVQPTGTAVAHLALPADSQGMNSPGSTAVHDPVASLPGPTRPDMLVIWPVETGFGIDVTWRGGEGNRRATVVRAMLEDASIEARLSQHPDGRRWELRVGPVEGAELGRLIDNFIW